MACRVLLLVTWWHNKTQWLLFYSTVVSETIFFFGNLSFVTTLTTLFKVDSVGGSSGACVPVDPKNGSTRVQMGDRVPILRQASHISCFTASATGLAWQRPSIRPNMYYSTGRQWCWAGGCYPADAAQAGRVRGVATPGLPK